MCTYPGCTQPTMCANEGDDVPVCPNDDDGYGCPACRCGAHWGVVPCTFAGCDRPATAYVAFVWAGCGHEYRSWHVCDAHPTTALRPSRCHHCDTVSHLAMC